MADDAFQKGKGVPGAFHPAGPGGKTDTVVLKPGASKDRKDAPPAPEQIDSYREGLETIVFVIILVMILKTFLAEAFVIPTGSMATTLYGYQMQVQCPECGYTFPANASQEAEPSNKRDLEVVQDCPCDNCKFTVNLIPSHPR